MNIRVEPAYTLIPITEVEIELQTGTVRSFVLYPDDTMTITETEIVIALHHPPEGETLTRPVCRISRRAGTKKIAVPPTPSAMATVTA